MTAKADFTAEEWQQAVAGPYFASFHIVFADLNVSYFKEIAAMAKAAMESGAVATSDLISDVATEMSSKDTQHDMKTRLEDLKRQKDPESLKAELVERTTASADVVTAKSEEDGQEYRKWLLYLAQATAEGSKEGGILGVGAVRVSDKEVAALEQLANALGVDAPSQ